MIKRLKITFLCGFALFSSFCGGPSSTNSETKSKPKSMVETAEEPEDPMANKGIGPVSEVTLGAEIDEAMAAEGKSIFETMCAACHKIDEKFIGPSPKGILKRRSPEWVMNMILNPEQMIKEDPVAKALFIEFNMSPMANQNLTEDQARKVLEYFRTLE
ncbi:cytochrome c [Fulvivirgaceae bacterium BMA12]|uniref:Cytochrome c n=1 Tax=Agaribacillus aureus TaxID=3051825 RepID=A0ABT8L0M5_9BACT|nr:cytochrome c [Fulvivirgaceae bacterium BMA12]